MTSDKCDCGMMIGQHMFGYIVKATSCSRYCSGNETQDICRVCKAELNPEEMHCNGDICEPCYGYLSF